MTSQRLDQKANRFQSLDPMRNREMYKATCQAPLPNSVGAAHRSYCMVTAAANRPIIGFAIAVLYLDDVPGRSLWFVFDVDEVVDTCYRKACQLKYLSALES
jgi:hypothetical protein